MFNFTINYKTSSIPLGCSLCFCNTCRILSGGGGISYLPTSYPVGENPIDPWKYALTPCRTSEDMVRYFCSTCGSHVCVHIVHSNTWKVATGIWDRTDGIIDWMGSKWIDETLDGGLSVALHTIKVADGVDHPLGRWMLNDIQSGRAVEAPPEQLLRYERPELPNDSEDRLAASCYCGGVKFYITRPNEASKKVRSTFPDFIVPFGNGVPPANPKNETWWLRCNDTKYIAGTCTCKSCRTSLGFEIQTWAFVPKCNIFQGDEKPMEYEMGTLKRYESSEGIWREFCGVCGATVFWHCDWRPDLVDVSTGLFDPKEGARAESWLEWWTERVSFKEMAVSTNLINALEDGLKGWKTSR